MRHMIVAALLCAAAVPSSALTLETRMPVKVAPAVVAAPQSAIPAIALPASVAPVAAAPQVSVMAALQASPAIQTMTSSDRSIGADARVAAGYQAFDAGFKSAAPESAVQARGESGRAVTLSRPTAAKRLAYGLAALTPSIALAAGEAGTAAAKSGHPISGALIGGAAGFFSVVAVARAIHRYKKRHAAPRQRSGTAIAEAFGMALEGGLGLIGFLITAVAALGAAVAGGFIGLLIGNSL